MTLFQSKSQNNPVFNWRIEGIDDAFAGIASNLNNAIILFCPMDAIPSFLCLPGIMGHIHRY